MKIAIDIQSAVTQKAGVGRYTRELIEHLAGLVDPNQLVPVYFDFKHAAEPISIPNTNMQAIRWIPGRIVQLAWDTIRFPPYNWFCQRADVYHFPNFILPPLTRGKAVVTIHDLAFLRYPQFAETRNVHYLNKHIRRTAERADAIITVSNFSAREVCNYLNVPPERVFPIHHGIDPRFSRPEPDAICEMRNRLGLNRPYLLTVGTVEPRKNIQHLVRVFERLNDFDGDLVIAGGMGWKTEPIMECIRKSTRADAIKCLGFTDDDTLPALYAGADLFLLSSFYEGFGFPPVESMACGTPVVSSTGGSLEEVLGEAAVLLAHFDVEGWTDAIRGLLGDSEQRQRLIEKGYSKAASYTWEKTARQTLDVFSQVAS
jgi:glycosyltransferase involved in cell wall biosynthesis